MRRRRVNQTRFALGNTADAFSALSIGIETATVPIARNRLDHCRAGSGPRLVWLPSVVEHRGPTLYLLDVAEGIDAHREEVHVSVCVHIYGYHRSRSR